MDRTAGHEFELEFLFLRAPGDDPPVYLYVEHDAAPKQLASSFSSFLIRSLDES